MTRIADRSEALPDALFPVICPHRERAKSTRHADYCTVIQPAALRALILQHAHTSDEVLCLALGCAAILLWSQQEAELRRLTLSQRISPEAWLQGIQRCTFLSTVLGEEARFVQHTLFALASPASTLSVPTRAHTPLHLERLPPYQAVLTLTQQLTWNVEPGDEHEEQAGEQAAAETETEEAARQRAESTLFHHCQALATAAAELSATLAMRPATHLAPEHLLPVERLRALTTTSLATCHALPTLPALPTTDLSAFVVESQLFEIWSVVALSLLQETITLLEAAIPDVLAVVCRINALTTLLHHLCTLLPLLPLPEHQAFQGPLRFRSDPRAWGCGAKSLPFRAIEILLGQHDAGSRTRLEQQGMWTPELDALWAAPSLHDALLTLLKTRGIFPPRARQPIFLGIQFAERLLEHNDEDADLWALLHALTCLKDTVHLWRIAHLEVAEHQSRHRVGSREAMQEQEGEHTHEAIGRAYLLRTLTAAPLFPELEAAWQLIEKRHTRQQSHHRQTDQQTERSSKPPAERSLHADSAH